MDVNSIIAHLFNVPPDAIESVGSEMTGGTGFLSYRRKLRIKRANSTISVFVKLSDRGRQDLGQLKDFSDHLCPRECLFYGCVAPLLERTAAQCGLGGIDLPVVHHELVLPSGTLLVMEDLEETGFQLAPAAMGVADARCVLGCLARLQAAFWLTKTRLGSAAKRLFQPDSPLANTLGSLTGSGFQLDEFLAHGLPVFRDTFAKYMNCERRVAIINAYLDDGFLVKARRVIEESREECEAAGLTHSDLWNANIMIRRSPTGEPVECRLIDWQFFGIHGTLAFDFGPLWVSSVDNAIVRTEFLPCVDFYHESIRSLFEAKSLDKFPVSPDQMRQQAIRSLNWGIAWVVLSADTLWAFGSVGNLLDNVADLIEHFSL